MVKNEAGSTATMSDRVLVVKNEAGSTATRSDRVLVVKLHETKHIIFTSGISNCIETTCTFTFFSQRRVEKCLTSHKFDIFDIEK